jgi:DNA-binding response OmpR family regulator
MPASILLVEDDQSIADVITEVLEGEGYRVLRADDGREGLEQIQRDGFDLLITDNMLPFHNGVELIAYMQNHPEIATPVILTSAARPIPVPPRTAFLPKPFNLDQLVTLVTNQLHSNTDKG